MFENEMKTNEFDEYWNNIRDRAQHDGLCLDDEDEELVVHAFFFTSWDSCEAYSKLKGTR